MRSSAKSPQERGAEREVPAEQEAEAALAACSAQRAAGLFYCRFVLVRAWWGSSALSPPFSWPGMVWGKMKIFKEHKWGGGKKDNQHITERPSPHPFLDRPSGWVRHRGSGMGC